MTRRDDLELSHGATAKVRENAVKQDRVRVTNAFGHHPERSGFLRRTEFIGGTTQFSDAIPKLKGLSRYAATHGNAFRRVDAVAKLGETFRVLDLTEQTVRSAVESAISIKALYESEVAANYTVPSINSVRRINPSLSG